jgi:glycerophosphoryl diester phosphodiesterase
VFAIGISSLRVPRSTFMDSFVIIGHRGTRGTYPENTLEGFAAAIASMADALELDVMRTSDDQIVIHHDEAITNAIHERLDGKTIDAPLNIRSLTLQQIKQYRYKPNPKFPRQKKIAHQIPSLEKLFELLHTLPHPNVKRIRLMLEIKKDPIDPQKTAELIVALVAKWKEKERVFYASFDPKILEFVHHADMEASLILLFEPKHSIDLELATRINAKIIGPSNTLLKSKRQVLGMKEKGFKIIPWTINDKQRCSELIEMGVDGIITDYPEDLIAFLQSNKAKQPIV